jgi:hypothetical protein
MIFLHIYLCKYRTLVERYRKDTTRITFVKGKQDRWSSVKR